MAVSIVSDRDFSKQVLHHDGPVMVAFRARWCAPSQQLAPLMDEVAQRYERRVKVVAVDVDDDPRANKLCGLYGVNRLPVTMLFRDGRSVDFVGGAASSETLADMVDRQLRPVLDVDEFNFRDEVLKSQVPVLLHVDAAWCAPSRQLAAVMEETAKRFQGRARVVRLEYGPATARLCAEYGFKRVPTVALFNDGRVVDQIFGAAGMPETRAAAPEGGPSGQTVAEMVDALLL